LGSARRHSGILRAVAFPYLSDLLRGVFGIDVPLPVPMFGLLVGVALFVSLWVAKLEAKRLMPEQPASHMDNAALTAFLAGLLGARLFHLLEYPREFLAHPLEMLFSRSGFTIFGGLIVGTLAGLVYARAKRIPVATLLDVFAPAMMLAYAIGRIGCQISGDGDWGVAADVDAKPAWLPLWLWAQTYDGNILGVTLPPPGVYPTPLYEVLMGLIAFAVLWKLRIHRHRPGWLFAVYLVLAGIERLLIEFIRVNTTYDLFGVAVTQAQLIATACVVAGCLGMWSLSRARTAPA
jgi:phosphatidylglycerol:prolipoprotein diacylglycerol transferase